MKISVSKLKIKIPENIGKIVHFLDKLQATGQQLY